MKLSNLFLGCLATLSLGAASTALAQDAMSREAIAERLAPVGELCRAGEDCGTDTSAPTPVSAGNGEASNDAASGEEIYANVCTACHETGAAGSPVRGDEEAWAPRMEQGMATLYDHSINGFNAMPAKGGNPNLTDQEVKNAVNYLTEPVRGDDVAIETGDDAAAGDPAGGDATAEGETQTASADTADSEASSSEDTAAAEQAAPEEAGDTTQVAASDDAASGGAAEGSDLPGADKIAVCTTCHGQDGHGTSPMYPNLAGQNATYLESSMKAYRAGERQGGMSAVMTPMATGLSDEDIKDIAEYYSQQTP